MILKTGGKILGPPRIQPQRPPRLTVAEPQVCQILQVYNRYNGSERQGLLHHKTSSGNRCDLKMGVLREPGVGKKPKRQTLPMLYRK